MTMQCSLAKLKLLKSGYSQVSIKRANSLNTSALMLSKLARLIETWEYLSEYLVSLLPFDTATYQVKGEPQIVSR